LYVASILLVSQFIAYDKMTTLLLI